MTSLFFFFFFNDTATTEIYTLSLHDALPISLPMSITTDSRTVKPCLRYAAIARWLFLLTDRKSTRLNSSHVEISYAVFCLKKKKNKLTTSHDDYSYRSPLSPSILYDIYAYSI